MRFAELQAAIAREYRRLVAAGHNYATCPRCQRGGVAERAA